MNKTTDRTDNKTNGKSNKDFAPNIGFWEAKTGNGYSVFISEELLETLNNAKVGGFLSLQLVPEDVRDANPKVPAYRLTIFPPKDENTL